MTRATRSLPALVRELRDRHVFRVAVLYVVVGFGAIQAADLLFPRLGLPEWTVQLVVGLTIVGLPMAVVLAWAFELTSEGLVRAAAETEGVIDRGRQDEGAAEGGADGVGEPADPRRIAILPLANIHPDRDQDYFADGMTEELISVVSRIQGLDVIARTSVMAYRDTSKSVREIGRELRVGTVLEGSVRKAGDQLRITVQLIDTRSQGHLWSEDYDREMKEIFQVQGDIARNVADALQVTLLGAEERRLERASTDNLEAYDLYLLGRHHLNKRSADGIRNAVQYFEAATGMDPSFALAHAGLADAYVVAGIGYAAIPDALQLAKKAALRALELDDELPEAHTSLGYVALNDGWDWQTAERELGRAIELCPSDAQAHQWFAQVALYRQRYAEAARRIDRPRELDPLSVVIQTESGWPYMYMGDTQNLEIAMARFREAARMDPSFALAHFNIGNCHEILGRLDEAIPCYQRAVELSQRIPFMLSFLGAALARTGKGDHAHEILDEVRGQVEGGAALSYTLAIIHEALGDKEEALDHLERSWQGREPVLLALGTVFLPMKALVDEPRFQAVLRAVHERLGIEP